MLRSSAKPVRPWPRWAHVSMRGRGRLRAWKLSSRDGVVVGAMYTTLRRMPEWCEPFIYHRVRPYIHGWKNHPDLPEGVIYEGVEAYGGKPQQFRGETGAQSSIVPALDAMLGVGHKEDNAELLSPRDAPICLRRIAPSSRRSKGADRAAICPADGQSGALTSAYNACRCS